MQTYGIELYFQAYSNYFKDVMIMLIDMREHKNKVNVSLLFLGFSLALVGCGSEDVLVKSEDLEYSNSKGLSSFNFTDINVDGGLLTFNWGSSVKCTDNSDVTCTVCKKDFSQPNNCLVVSDLIGGDKVDVDIEVH